MATHPEVTERALREVKSSSHQIEREDYIVAVGDVVLLALAIASALNRNGRAQVLRWDSKSKEYCVEVITA